MMTQPKTGPNSRFEESFNLVRPVGISQNQICMNVLDAAVSLPEVLSISDSVHSNVSVNVESLSTSKGMDQLGSSSV
jgi:hypothetical protein